jgi:hypothetical protein
LITKLPASSVEQLNIPSAGVKLHLVPPWVCWWITSKLSCLRFIKADAKVAASSLEQAMLTEDLNVDGFDSSATQLSFMGLPEMPDIVHSTWVNKELGAQ